MKIVFCLAVGLLLVLHSPPSSLSGVLYDQDQADVTLTIETYGKISPPLGGCNIVMNPIIPAMIASPDPFGTNGTCLLSVDCNVNAFLKCPKVMTLSDGNTYTPDVDLVLLNINIPITQDLDYWYAHYTPGSYPDETALQVGMEKVWTVLDLAGIYTGTVELTLWEE